MKSKKQNKVRVNVKEPDLNRMASMEDWKNLARAACPEIDDGWLLSELATINQQFIKALGMHFLEASEICTDAEGRAVNIGVGILIDRTNTPSEIKVTISYAKRFRHSLSVMTPDPEQTELPFPAVPDVEENQDQQMEMEDKKPF